MTSHGDPRTGHGDPSQMPVDLIAVTETDLLLDQLGDPRAPARDDLAGVDGELARTLVGWRVEVHTDSIRELVDVDTALAAIQSTSTTPRYRMSFQADLIATVIAIVLIVGSLLGLVAYSAEVGDLLYPLRELLYGGPR